MPRRNQGQVNVSLPADLMAEIDRIRADTTLGYVSRADVVRDACRHFIKNHNEGEG